MVKFRMLFYYNREIYNRVDDSVGFVVNNKLRMARRSRGYAPSPFLMDSITEGILATGAELNNLLLHRESKAGNFKSSMSVI